MGILMGILIGFEKKSILDKSDPFSELNKIPLGPNRTHRIVYSKINFKVEICTDFRYSIGILILSVSKVLSSILYNNHYYRDFLNTVTKSTITVCVVIIYCTQ